MPLFTGMRERSIISLMGPSILKAETRNEVNTTSSRPGYKGHECVFRKFIDLVTKISTTSDFSGAYSSLIVLQNGETVYEEN